MLKNLLDDKNGNSCKISQKSDETYFFHVPKEIYLLHAHRGYTSCGSDDEDAAAGSSTIGQKFPENMIGGVLLEGIHALSGCNQGYVVNNG